jgi:hypothetical protein
VTPATATADFIMGKPTIEEHTSTKGSQSQLALQGQDTNGSGEIPSTPNKQVTATNNSPASSTSFWSKNKWKGWTLVDEEQEPSDRLVSIVHVTPAKRTRSGRVLGRSPSDI